MIGRPSNVLLIICHRLFTSLTDERRIRRISGLNTIHLNTFNLLDLEIHGIYNDQDDYFQLGLKFNIQYFTLQFFNSKMHFNILLIVFKALKLIKLVSIIISPDLRKSRLEVSIQNLKQRSEIHNISVFFCIILSSHQSKIFYNIWNSFSK